MKIFCDTSVLVAASLQTHLHHEPAKAALLRIRQGHDEGYACAHALAETFSVLSRMPTKPKLLPEDVLDILKQGIIPHFIFVALQSEDYPLAISDLVAKRMGGGRIYDLLHLRAAGKLALDRIYTFNDSEWKTLSPAQASVICAPPTVPTTPPRS